ncbi:MAG: glycosyltransferase [bacterium]|nr:glycosyltransferase [bacterium]
MFIFWATPLLIIIFSFISYSNVFLIIFESLLFISFFLRSSRKLKKPKTPVKEYPFVSIIVPMRNEEKNVVSCINSLAALNYENLEIIIANDSSTDNTKNFVLETIKKFSSKISIKIFDVPTPPKEWLGKPWAVNEAVKLTKGKLMLIVDADVRLKPESLKNSVNHLLASEAEILFRFSRLIIRKWRDWPFLFLNFIFRFSFWFSSLLEVEQSPVSWGENILLYKNTYDEIGGYEKVKNYVPEIQAFIKIAINLKKKVAVVDENSSGISVFLYDNFKESLKGIIRSMDFRLVNFSSFATTFILVAFSIDGVIKILTGFPEGGFSSYAIFVFIFGLYLLLNRQPVYIAVFSPILGFYVIIVFIIAGFCSFFKKSITWKDRVVKLT